MVPQLSVMLIESRDFLKEIYLLVLSDIVHVHVIMQRTQRRLTVTIYHTTYTYVRKIPASKDVNTQWSHLRLLNRNYHCNVWKCWYLSALQAVKGLMKTCACSKYELLMTIVSNSLLMELCFSFYCAFCSSIITYRKSLMSRSKKILYAYSLAWMKIHLQVYFYDHRYYGYWTLFLQSKQELHFITIF